MPPGGPRPSPRPSFTYASGPAPGSPAAAAAGGAHGAPVTRPDTPVVDEHGSGGGTGNGTAALLAAALAGGAVALAVGTYGRVHQPTGGNITSFGFPTLISMKVWLGTVAFTLAMLQLTSALAMWGRLPGMRGKKAPKWLPPVHRWTGTAAFVVSLPVAYHCLWSLGFQDTDTRVLAHSLFGCAFYGAMTTKLLVLRADRLPGMTLPIVGGLLVTCLTGLWLTSSLWFFTNVEFPGF
jgi:hypothetical protein